VLLPGDNAAERTINSSARPTVQLMPLGEALSLGCDIWSALHARSPAPSPFMTWAWHRSWAEAAERDEVESSRVFVLRSGGGQTEALFPFRVFRARFRRVPIRVLGWAIGDLGCPDHLEVPALPGADLDALVPELERLPWDAVRLDNVGEHSPNVERLCAACERRGWTVRRFPLSRCPYIALPDSWAVYLSGLSANRRHALLRSERMLYGAHRVTLTEYAADRLEEGWRCLLGLHIKRWGAEGHLAMRALTRLHGKFASLLPPRGAVWLASLALDGKPAAAWYGFAVGDTVYFYNGGWDTTFRRRSVGHVLTGMMIRRAIEQRYRVFDFMRGEEPYKRIWTRVARTCYRLLLFRPGWRGTALRWLDSVSSWRSALLAAWPAGLATWFSWLSEANWYLDVAS